MTAERVDGPIVIALGGNALLQHGERGAIEEQFRHTRESLAVVVELARAGRHIVIVHGNGPQVGDELQRNEAAREQVPPFPLGVLVAATQGWIGYMIQQSLENALSRAGVVRPVVTVMTQVEVSSNDPALQRADKVIGRPMDVAEQRRAAHEGQATVERGGEILRVVSSPAPIGIIETPSIRALLDSGVIVIAAGGGGVPVYRTADGRLEGLDVVVDKDRAAAVLGRSLNATDLLILTDVDGVYHNFGEQDARLIERMTVSQAEQMLEMGEFGRGSMAPKVEASIAFVRTGGKAARIARLNSGLQAVEGQAGTLITMDQVESETE